MPDSDSQKPSIYCSIRRVTRLVAISFVALLGSGCLSFEEVHNPPAPQVIYPSVYTNDAFAVNKKTAQRLMHQAAARDQAAKEQVELDIWQRISHGYQLQHLIDNNPRVDQQRLWFASRSKVIENISERSSPYMYYVVESLAARNMPLELALLPMIESGYNPHAYSTAHASGLWQFIPSTGRHFKLKQSHWYDARRDIMASTQAALNYLQYLHNMFDNDWLLALAAYNSGEGTVARSIKRNESRNLPTDYWNLNLPAETQAYVPKLLAISQLISAPLAYDIALSPIANEPYFTAVPLKQQMEIGRLAKLAKLDEKALVQLNPAYKQGITYDGPQHLLVPLKNAQLLTAQLSTIKPSDRVQWQQYTVRSGDNLSTIASRHHVSVALIKDINKLSSNSLRIGQVLNIHQGGANIARMQPPTRSSQPSRTTYTVRSGDNLSMIAARQKISVANIKRWNKLSSNALKIGQKLTLVTGSSSGQQLAQRSRAIQYKVRPGDSLYVIAKRHKVSLKQLQNWNPKASKALKPGQTLSLYL